MLPHGWNINNGYILMKSDFTGYYWQMFFLSSLQEKYVMLDFGVSWCGWCIDPFQAYTVIITR